ncbi:MAG TPA: histidine phosphatase family protein [Anaerolineae bacterium]|nr:histidine phosphatase family protein [Anaerolineae bacterium]HQI85327.1 histidine phosphatase family protein [Anaerolineae bacterium]
MKTLLIMRHAKSSWKNEALTDHDRPLKKRGEYDAVQMGKRIRQNDLTPQRIISSTAKRALKTAELVAEACHYDERIIATRAFYGAEPDEFIAVLRQLDDADERVMVVGHNPDLEMLLESLTGALESLPTAAVAQVTLPINTWAELAEDTPGKLVQLLAPINL